MPDKTTSISWIAKAKERASTQGWIVGWILILAITGKYGLSFFNNVEDLSSQIDRVVILLCLSVLLVGTFFRQLRVNRSERYALINDKMHFISHRSRDLQSFINNYIDSGREIAHFEQTEKIFREKIEEIVDLVAELFSEITEARVRCAIKLVDDSGDNLYAFAFARDQRSRSACAVRDNDRFERKSDKIVENEDFQMIFHKKEPYFFEEDLARRGAVLQHQL